MANSQKKNIQSINKTVKYYQIKFKNKLTDNYIFSLFFSAKK